MINRVKNQYNPDFVTPPGETLLETLDVLSMSQAELAERTGRPKKTINEIIRGKAAITSETALQFEKVLGIPAGFWISREQNYQEWLAREQERSAFEKQLSWIKQFPVTEMIKLGWIEYQDDPTNQLNELLRYFGIASPQQWEPVYSGLDVAYRRSRAFQTEPAITSVWLRKGEIEAQKIDCAPFDSDAFKMALGEIRTLTNEDTSVFVRKMVELCARAGVAVAFVHELRKLRTSGATRWIHPTKALMQLSLLYKTDDHLWFTFFHEAGHILLHGKRDVFLEGSGAHEETDEKEEQANRFASEWLIPLVAIRIFTQAGTISAKLKSSDLPQVLELPPALWLDACNMMVTCR
jgi:addiction module HigA family antidote